MLELEPRSLESQICLVSQSSYNFHVVHSKNIVCLETYIKLFISCQVVSDIHILKVDICQHLTKLIVQGSICEFHLKSIQETRPPYSHVFNLPPLDLYDSPVPVMSPSPCWVSIQITSCLPSYFELVSFQRK